MRKDGGKIQNLKSEIQNLKSPTWRSAGAWFGGTISALAISPHFASDRLVLAATLAGIYRSKDGGHHWQPSSQGLSDLTAHSVLLTLDKDERLVAFAATRHGRLYISPDAGESWEEVTAWAGLGVITALVTSPAYAGDGTLFAATEEGIFRSFDRGQHWESAGFGLLDPEVLCLACDPDFARTETVWAGTAAGGFYRSRNAGRAWRESGFGLPDCAVQCLALAPDFAESRTMFAGTEGAGVYCSTDAGANWAPAGDELAGGYINCLALSPAYHQDRTLLAGTPAGIFISVDGGTHWQPVQAEQVNALALAYAGETVALAGNYRTGVALSEDQGWTWQPVNIGLAARVPPLAVIGPQAELVAAALDGGVVFSRDEGVTWQEQYLDPEFSEAQLLAASGPVIFAAVGARLYRTKDLSQGWSPLNLPPEVESFINLLALSPNFERWPEVVIGTAAGHLYRSPDGGDHWQPHPAPPELKGMALSAVFGEDAEGLSLYLIGAIEIEPEGYQLELWQQETLNSSWQALVSIDPVKIPLATLVVPLPPAPLFLALQNQVIRLSRRPGQPQLEAVQTVLGEDLNITSLVILPGPAPDYVLAVATDKGVFYCGDGGLTWQPLGQGLEGRAVVALLPPSAGVQGRLGAVTLGGEVWWLENWKVNGGLETHAQD